MAVLRHRHERDFTVIPNDLLRNSDLGLKDIGLLTFMLSLPDGWEFSISGLCTMLQHDGRDAITKSLQRIEGAGYLRRERTRGADGRVSTVVWEVSDLPISPGPDFPEQVFPDTVFPDTVFPDVENPPQIKNRPNKEPTNKESTDKEQNNTARVSRSDDFERFWTAYPRKVGKAAAEKAFGKVQAPIETLLAAIEKQKHSAQWNKESGQYIPNPSTWLNQGRWEDELEPQKPGGSEQFQNIPGVVYC